MAHKKDPAFLFYTKDFLAMIQDLTLEERGQFITLLCIQHQNGHLSSKTIGISVGTATADVMAKFRQDDGGLWFNEWLEGLIEERKSYTDSQRDKALKQWEKRKGAVQQDAPAPAPAKAVAEPLPLPPVNVNADVNANTDTKKKVVRKKKVLPIEDTVFPTFNDFWEAGLAKVGRDIAQRKWYSLRQEDKLAAMAFIPKYLRSNELQYLKRPPAFLNQKTWQDEIIDRTDAKRIAANAGKHVNAAAVLDRDKQYGNNF